jgi:hypothetical protein
VQGTVYLDTYWKTGLADVGNSPVLLDPSIFHFLLLWIILQGSCFPIKQKNSYNNHQILRGHKHHTGPYPQMQKMHYMVPYTIKLQDKVLHTVFQKSFYCKENCNATVQHLRLAPI